ncbi:MAG: hypothetical protein NW703_12640 [Nitrospiraceae bacterium]
MISSLNLDLATLPTSVLLEPLEMIAQRMMAILPNVLAMSLILIGGILAAWGTRVLIERTVHLLGVDQLSDRLGFTTALLRGGVKVTPSRMFGQTGYWIVLGFAVLAAIGALHVEAINHVSQAFLSYIPYLLTACVIMLAGYVLSNFVARAVLIASVNAGLPPAKLLAACARWGLLLAAAAMALEQLGIAEHIVVVGFAITFGGIVLAATLACGLGAQDLAKQWLEAQFYGRTRWRIPDDLRH